MTKRSKILLADADILIDYTNSKNLEVLSFVGKYTGPLYVLNEILDTVAGLSETECKRHGIKIVETETEVLLDAGSRKGPLSFEDWLCYLTCKQNGWICVSNDNTLIRTCCENSVDHCRGLRLIIDLVSNGHINQTNAIRIAKAIQKSNPYHITDQVLEEFVKVLS